MTQTQTIDAAEYQTLVAKAEHSDAVREKSNEIARLRSDYDAKRDESLAAKKTLDAALRELQELGAEEGDPQMRLPMDGVPEEKHPDYNEKNAPKLKVTDTEDDESDDEEYDDVEDDEEVSESNEWRDESVDGLNLATSFIRKLKEQDPPIDTLGKLDDMAAKRNEKYPDGLMSVKGWGEPRAKIIQKALDTKKAEFAVTEQQDSDDDDNDGRTLVRITEVSEQLAKAGANVDGGINVDDEFLVNMSGRMAIMRGKDGTIIHLTAGSFAPVEETQTASA